MTETWRRKTYYGPRVLIETARVLDSQFEDAVLCITGAQLELLRNLMQYLHRRSTFASEYDAAGYLAPNNEEWDSIQAIVADLEEKLMGCEEFLTLLEGILEQVTCVCQQSMIAAQTLGNLPIYGPSLQPVIEEHLVDGSMQVEDNYGSGKPSSGDRCAVAQLTYALAYEMTTEILQPAASEAVDVLLPLAMVALAVMCGTSVLGIPVGVLLATLWSIIKIDVEGSIEDVRNAILASKEDLICAVWRGMMFGREVAQANAAAVIAEMSGLSALDKVALRLLFTPFMMHLAGLAHGNSTSWAAANIEAGFCDDCDEIIGEDWWALALEPVTNTISLVNTGNAHWESECWEGTVPASQTCCGVVFRVLSKEGDCVLKCMGEGEAGCTGTELWTNQALDLGEGVYLALNNEYVDETDVLDTLCPDATIHPATHNMSRIVGPDDVSGGFQLGWACEGSATIVFLFQVFEGTSPS